MSSSNRQPLSSNHVPNSFFALISAILSVPCLISVSFYVPFRQSSLFPNREEGGHRENRMQSGKRTPRAVYSALNARANINKVCDRLALSVLFGKAIHVVIYHFVSNKWCHSCVRMAENESSKRSVFAGIFLKICPVVG